jgi:hypothetical protein
MSRRETRLYKRSSWRMQDMSAENKRLLVVHSCGSVIILIHEIWLN